MQKCPKCQHTYAPGEGHECPSPEYLRLRDDLIEAACDDDPGEGHEEYLA